MFMTSAVYVPVAISPAEEGMWVELMPYRCFVSSQIGEPVSMQYVGSKDKIFDVHSQLESLVRKLKVAEVSLEKTVIVPLVRLNLEDETEFSSVAVVDEARVSTNLLNDILS